MAQALCLIGFPAVSACGTATSRQCSSLSARQARRWPRVPHASADDAPEPVDIDELAARLAAEAERRRREGADLSVESEGPAAPPPLPGGGREPPFGYQSKAAQADVLAAIGDGGLSASEFDLVSELGRISVQQQEEAVGALGGLPAPPSASTQEAVIAYTASFFTGMPFQDPVLALLLEYLPEAAPVALNELQILTHLAGIPKLEDKWTVASAPLSSAPPVVRLIGYFLAGQSAQGAGAMPGGVPYEGDVLWVAKKWDGLAPLALYPAAQQTSGFGLGRLFGGRASELEQRARMVQAIARGCLAALAFCHGRGVAHGSLGSGSVLLSTFDDRAANRLVVKLDNFGFGKRVSLGSGGQPAVPLAQDDTPFGLGQKADLRALALVLLEAVLSGLAAGGPSPATSAPAVQRLLGDVFQYDVQEFRQYCRSEPDWEVAVALLEDRQAAGWELLAALVEGGAPAAALLTSPFCAP